MTRKQHRGPPPTGNRTWTKGAAAARNMIHNESITACVNQLSVTRAKVTGFDTFDRGFCDTMNHWLRENRVG